VRIIREVLLDFQYKFLKKPLSCFRKYVPGLEIALLFALKERRKR